jgi:nitrate reductase NapE component
MGAIIFSYGIVVLGFSIILLGIIIWKKQNINLIHGRNKIDINNEDIKEYTESIGKSYIIIGFATLVGVIIRITDNDLYDFIGFISWMLGIIIGMVKFVRTEKKYKTGIWK